MRLVVISSVGDSDSPAKAICKLFMRVVRCFDVASAQTCIHVTFSSLNVQLLCGAQCTTTFLKSVTDVRGITRN